MNATECPTCYSQYRDRRGNVSNDGTRERLCSDPWHTPVAPPHGEPGHVCDCEDPRIVGYPTYPISPLPPSAPSRGGEPVAWHIYDKDGPMKRDSSFDRERADNDCLSFNCDPTYAHRRPFYVVALVPRKEES